MSPRSGRGRSKARCRETRKRSISGLHDHLCLIKNRPRLKSETYVSFSPRPESGSPLEITYRERANSAAMLRVLIFLVSLGTRALRTICRRRADLVMENLALRQQVMALKKERPHPLLGDIDRSFWVALRSSWPAWASRLVIVNADTVARWNRDRFRRYWTRISRRRYPGRPRIDAEIRHLIRKMAQDGWGAPRIHGELTKLGFVISEMSVSRYMPRRPAEADQVKRWPRHEVA